MKVVLIGARGGIGQRVLRALKNSEHEIYAISSGPVHDKDIVSIRISERISSFDEALSGIEPDIIINASGSPTVGFSYKNPEFDRYLNVSIPKMIGKWILKHRMSCRFINFSSAAVYGNPLELPISETTPTIPLSPYGHHKLEAELWLKEMHSNGLQSVSFRIFSAYGVGLKKQLFWDILQKCTHDQVIKLYGTGKESRDFISTDDIASICIQYINRGQFKGEAVNICSGVESTIESAARTLMEAMDLNREIIFTGEERIGDPVNWRGDNTLLRSMLNFTPTELRIGLRSYSDWIKTTSKERTSPN